MSYVTWKLVHIPFINNSWDVSQSSEITRFNMPQATISLGDKRDTFKFTVVNYDDTFSTFFNPEDQVYIFRTVNSDTIDTTSITNLIMRGSIKDVPVSLTARKNVFRVEGYNFSENVARAIVFSDPTGQPINVGLQQALQNAASNNSAFVVTWATSNPTTKTDGDPFPNMTERFFHKPFRDIIEKYSADQKTKDGNYYWYINNQNELIWKQANTFGSGEFDESVTPYLKIKVEKDIKGIKNYLIAKGGLDPAGNQIQRAVSDGTSINKHGRKYGVFVLENNNAKELNRLDLVKSYGTTNPNSSYPQEILDNTDFTTEWYSSITTTVNGINMTEGSQVTITGADVDERKDNYVAVIRKEVDTRLNIEGTRYIDAVKYGKLKIDLDFRPGIVDWGLGQNISCTIPSAFTGVKTLRVVEIQYGESSDSYSLEEDEGTLGDT